ncbi:MAG: CDP-diacylglycerol--glycerol-3-phosphate 3-phosphatidyltransferase [Deltaproteobacteria bacterium RIFCSPHIGHO2_02_FULL_40_11]|nr:MAG: CDP-diacylglycerol--glycerol-3-phosphate 3-phosphatidyltransferase [Deltaproteobacteria bacterium RIFCSPHIGHO2_02_FULL_40_11]
MNKGNPLKSVTLPTLITLSRFAVIPLIMLLLLSSSGWTGLLAGILITLAGITDFMDGYLARYYKVETDLGKFLDPLADKVLVVSALIMLSALSRVHAILVVIIVCREIFITGLRAIASNEGIVIAASQLGKYKTFLQICAIVGLSVHETYFGFNFQAVGLILIYISLGFSLYSAYEYVKLFFDKILQRS